MFAGQMEFVKVSGSQVGDYDYFNLIAKVFHFAQRVPDVPNVQATKFGVAKGMSCCGRPSMLKFLSIFITTTRVYF